MLDEKDKDILTDAFVNAMNKFKEINKPPKDLETHRFQGMPMNSKSTRLTFSIPVGRSEYTTDPNSDLVGSHIVNIILATPLPEPAGLQGTILNEDGSITFKFSKKTNFPIAYNIQFVK